MGRGEWMIEGEKEREGVEMGEKGGETVRSEKENERRRRREKEEDFC